MPGPRRRTTAHAWCARALATVVLACTPTGPTNHPDQGKDEEKESSSALRVGHATCVVLTPCLDPLRHALAKEPAMLAAMEKVIAPDRRGDVWIYATPPDRFDVVFVLPVRGDKPRKALADAGLEVSGTDASMSVGGWPARIVDHRLLVATDPSALRAAAKASEPTVASNGAIAVAELDLAAIPDSVRNAWLDRLHEGKPGPPEILPTLARAARVEAFADAFRDGVRVEARLAAHEGRQELVVDVTAREGSWLATHAERNTSLKSKVAALAPANAVARMSWSEIEALPEDERDELMKWFDELEAVLSRYPKQLGFVGGAELEVVPLLQDMLELGEVVLDPRQLDYVAFVPADGASLVVGVNGLPGPRVEGVFVRTIATLKRHELPWITSVTSKKQKKRSLHEIVIDTPPELQGRFGPSTSITFGTAGDVVLFAAQGKATKPILPGLLDAVPRTKEIPVAIHEGHVDVTQLAAVLPPAFELRQRLGANTDALALDYVVRAQDNHLVATMHLDLGAWLGVLARSR